MSSYAGGELVLILVLDLNLPNKKSFLLGTNSSVNHERSLIRWSNLSASLLRRGLTIDIQFMHTLMHTSYTFFSSFVLFHPNF